MNLLDLPPEIFYKIIEEYVASTSYQSDLKNLQLVNKHFCFEVARAVCTTQSLFNLANPAPFYPEYLRYTYYISNKKDDYLARTMKKVTNQLIIHDASEKKEDIREKVALDVANAALDFMVPGLAKAMKDGSTEEVPLPSRLCLGYIHRIDEYEFDRSMRLGMGQTPDSLGHVLSAAAYVGNISLVESLLDQDNTYCNFRSNLFGQPLRNAAFKGHIEVVRLLLDNGADAEDGRYPPPTEDYQVEGMRRATRMFLIHRLPYFHTRPATALQAAARSAHREIVRLLLQPEHHVSRSSHNYRDAVMFAAWGGDTEILDRLLKGMDFELFNRMSHQLYWDHMLHLAAFNGNIGMMRVLLRQGAEANSRGSTVNFVTPLAIAAFNGHNDAIIFLLNNGANIDLGDLPPLYMASAYGFAQTVRLLLDRGAQINRSGCRSIEVATRKGYDDVVRVFSERGLYNSSVRPLIGEEGHRSLIALARSSGHQRVARVLEELGARE